MLRSHQYFVQLLAKHVVICNDLLGILSNESTDDNTSHESSSPDPSEVVVASSRKRERQLTSENEDVQSEFRDCDKMRKDLTQIMEKYDWTLTEMVEKINKLFKVPVHYVNYHRIHSFMEKEGSLGGTSCRCYPVLIQFLEYYEQHCKSAPDTFPFIKKRKLQIDANDDNEHDNLSSSETFQDLACVGQDIFDDQHIEEDISSPEAIAIITSISIPTQELIIYDSCDEVRRKMEVYLTYPSMTKYRFAKLLHDKYSTSRLNAFLYRYGETNGIKNQVFHMGYLFFEKLRLYLHQEKNASRVQQELYHPEGYGSILLHGSKDENDDEDEKTGDDMEAANDDDDSHANTIMHEETEEDIWECFMTESHTTAIARDTPTDRSMTIEDTQSVISAEEIVRKTLAQHYSPFPIYISDEYEIENEDEDEDRSEQSDHNDEEDSYTHHHTTTQQPRTMSPILIATTHSIQHIDWTSRKVFKAIQSIPFPATSPYFIYDTCEEIRHKLTILVQAVHMKYGRVCRLIGPTMRTKGLHRFLSFQGKHEGMHLKIYREAYILFEKIRLYRQDEKSISRTQAEQEFPRGLIEVISENVQYRTQDSEHVIVHIHDGYDDDDNTEDKEDKEIVEVDNSDHSSDDSVIIISPPSTLPIRSIKQRLIKQEIVTPTTTQSMKTSTEYSSTVRRMKQVEAHATTEAEEEEGEAEWEDNMFLPQQPRTTPTKPRRKEASALTQLLRQRRTQSLHTPSMNPFLVSAAVSLVNLTDASIIAEILQTTFSATDIMTVTQDNRDSNDSDNRNHRILAIYDTCEEIREKMMWYLALPAMSRHRFGLLLGDFGNWPQDSFLSKQGEMNGIDCLIYPYAYMFFEKMRLYLGEKKSMMRLQHERKHPEGYLQVVLGNDDDAADEEEEIAEEEEVENEDENEEQDEEEDDSTVIELYALAEEEQNEAHNEKIVVQEEDEAFYVQNTSSDNESDNDGESEFEFQTP